MMKLPSRFRRLDDALADLPGDEPMLLTELDGFLTGLLVCPDLILPGEWMPVIWADSGEAAPFEDPEDVRLFTGMVLARYNEIVRDLGRRRPQPIFDVDERNGEVLWDYWIEGFDLAIRMRPDSWATVRASGEAGAIEALAGLGMLIEVAREESELTSVEINPLCDEAPALIPSCVMRLHDWRLAHRAIDAAPARTPAKVGRNDPCPCGSGKKYKRCCGLN